MKVLLAGATGYLGSYIAKTLLHQQIDFKAIARHPKKLIQMGIPAANIVTAEVTQSASIKGICDQMDAVISTIGITRQKDGLSYMDVDYQANKNLLEEALRSGVKKFIYVSVLRGEELTQLEICAAKERFVSELKAAGIDYSIVRPSGFFSDIAEFYHMAQKGRVYLFGDGQVKVNPIHGADLAAVCVQALFEQSTEIEVGGPQVLTHQAIAEAAFSSIDRKAKITYIPDWVRRVGLRLARLFLPKAKYGPIEFFLQVMTMDMVGAAHGKHTLQGFFAELARAEEPTG